MTNQRYVEARWPHKVSVWLPLACFVMVCLWVAIARSAGIGVYRSDGGDIATWIFVHEWLSRGFTLYLEVWEHKDFGFLMLLQPFYRVGSTFGLYVSGLLASFVLAVGLFVGLRRYLPRVWAVCLAGIGLIVYVLSPTYLSVYKESYAIAFGVLAISLVGSRPAIGGALIGLSTAFKVSGLGILVLVAMVMLLESVLQRRQFRPIANRLGRLVFGFSTTLGLMCAWAYQLGILGSWIEVVRYNVEYSAFRRESFGEVADLRGFLALLSPGYDTVVYLLCLTIALAVLIGVLMSMRTMSSTCSTVVDRMSHVDFNLLYGFALVGATFVAIISQTPPRFQHYTYFVGALIYVCALLAATIVKNSLSLISRNVRLLSTVVTVLLGVGLVQAVRADGLTWPVTNLRYWSELDTIDSPLPELQVLPENSRIAFVNLGGSRINLVDLHPSTQLACRFFFHYPNLTAKYGTQMLDCLRIDIDYVVLGGKAEMSESFNDQLETVLRRDYVSCTAKSATVVLWATSERHCQIVTDDSTN